MKRILTLMLVSAMIFSLMAGCQSANSVNDSSEEKSTNGSSESSSSTQDGQNIRTDVVIGASADIVTLDPAKISDTYSGEVAQLIYDKLVTLDENANIIPSLPESWENTSDTEYIFHLRQGVKFHNGEELKASDVVFTFNRARESAQAKANFEMVSSVEAVDDYTVKLTTSAPFAPMLLKLTQNTAYILSEKAVTEAEADGGEYGENPVGTGCMTLKEYQPNDHCTLVRFDDYWGGEVKATSITRRVIPEDSSRTIALENGEIDYINELPAVDIDRLKEDENIKTVDMVSASVSFIAFNCQKEPFNNVKVRQALHYAVDKQTIIDVIYEGYGVPCNSVFPTMMPGYDSELNIYSYDLEKAKQLLTEAGYPDGFDMEILVSNEIRSRICQIIQQDYASIGVNMEISVVEFGTLVEMSTGEDYDAFLLGWSQAVDADNTMVFSFHSDNFGSKGNRARYSNPEFDEIVMQARVEMDETKRNELYKEAQRIVMEDSPWIPIMQAVNVAGMDKGVEGVVMYEHGARYYRNMVVVED